MSNLRCNLSDYFQCLQGLKQVCSLSPILFSMLINDLASEIISKAKHGVKFSLSEIELVILLFADDLTLFSSTQIGLQTQLNALSDAAKRLFLTVNMTKSTLLHSERGNFFPKRILAF